ncbi:MAG: alpha/beta fold hydrolase [Nannocystaceae bacterium]|nr:alpha/beta fold hydrolase [Nannocystaceae bacterium]
MTRARSLPTLLRPLRVALLLLFACRRGPTPASEPPAPVVTPEAKPTPAPAATPAVQYFMGAIELPGAQLPFFVVVRERDGKPSALLDIPAQAAFGLPLSDVRADDEAVTFRAAQVGASWRATLDAEGDPDECSFSQGGATLPCSLARVDEATWLAARKPKRPQLPQPPLPYATREVAVKSGDVTLAGTLAVPAGAGPHPAALLLTGSGAQDRDETLFDHKPFFVLADHLARHGIATLRLDDRGVGGSGGDLGHATLETLVDDAVAAVAWMRTQPELAPAKIGVIGHSEGGLVGPAAAARSRDVAFVVMLAGPGLPGGDVIVDQLEVIARRSGASEADIAQALAQQRQVIAAVREHADAAARRAALEPLLAGDAAATAQLEAAVSPWFRSFVVYDPAPTLRKLRQPVLALLGGLDVQVTAAANAAPLRKALAKNRRARVREFAGLNHLFQHASSGLVGEYGTIEETMAPEVLDAIATWIASDGVGKPAR